MSQTIDCISSKALVHHVGEDEVFGHVGAEDVVDHVLRDTVADKLQGELVERGMATVRFAHLQVVHVLHQVVLAEPGV